MSRARDRTIRLVFTGETKDPRWPDNEARIRGLIERHGLQAERLAEAQPELIRRERMAELVVDEPEPERLVRRVPLPVPVGVRDDVDQASAGPTCGNVIVAHGSNRLSPQSVLDVLAELVAGAGKQCGPAGGADEDGRQWCLLVRDTVREA